MPNITLRADPYRSATFTACQNCFVLIVITATLHIALSPYLNIPHGYYLGWFIGGIAIALTLIIFDDGQDYDLEISDGVITGPGFRSRLQPERVSFPIEELRQESIPDKITFFSPFNPKLVSKSGERIAIATNYHSKRALEDFFLALHQHIRMTKEARLAP